MSFSTIRFSCGVQLNKHMYVSCLDFNQLCRINPYTDEYVFLGEFPKSDKYSRELHRNAIVYGETIFFVLQSKGYIHTYNIKRNRFGIISLHDNTDYDAGFIGIEIGNKLYMVPQKKGGNIFEVNMDTFESKPIILWNEYCSKLQLTSKELLFIRIAGQGNQIYMPIFGGSQILILDVCERKTEIISLEVNNLFGCFKGKDCIWILANGGNEIFCFDILRKKTKKHEHVPNNESNGRELNWIIESKHSVYALPGFGNAIYRLSGDIFENINMGEVNKCFEGTTNQKCYEPIFDEDNDCIWILPREAENMVCIHGDEVRALDKYKQNENSPELKKRIKHFIEMNKSSILMEKRDWLLEDFILGVCML